MSGKVQVGAWFPFENIDFPLINTVHMASSHWYCPDGTTDDPLAYINASGYPTQMPADGKKYRLRNVCGYVVSGEQWILTWDGTATVAVSLFTGSVSFSSSVAANRIACTITGTENDVFNVAVDVTSVGAGFGNLRFFRASYETRLNSGEKFDPNFLTRYSGWKAVRFMDYLSTNDSPQVSWANRVTESQLSWVGTNVLTSRYAGKASKANNVFTTAAAVSGNPSSWSHGMVVQARVPAPTWLTVANFGAGAGGTNPARVQFSTTHGWSTGQKGVFTSGSMHGGTIAANLAGNEYTFTVVSADTISLDGVDCSTWGTYTTDGSGKFGLTPSLSCGALPQKRVIQITLDNPSFSGWGQVDALMLFTYDSLYDCLIYSQVWSASVTDLSNPLTGRTGFPIETIVDLANQLNVYPWICLPHMADDNYVTQCATYVRDNLSVGLTVYFELSNEVWNSQFTQTAYASSRAIKAGFTSSANQYDLWHGYRFYQVMSLVGGVFSGQMGRVKRVMAVFTGGYRFASVLNRFQAPGTGLADYPISVADAVALGLYYESRRADTAVNQYVWQGSQGTPSQKQDAIVYFDGKLRDDGARFTGTISGNTLTITNLISGVVRVNDAIYGGGIGVATPNAINRTITAGSGNSWTISGASLGNLGPATFDTTSGNYCLKTLRDIVIPSWKQIADAPASSVGPLDLICYEAGSGQFLQTGVYTIYPSTTYDPGTGAVTLTNTDLFAAYNSYFASPECALTLYTIWRNFEQAGGKMMSQYTLTSSASSPWGLARPTSLAALNKVGDALTVFNSGKRRLVW